MLITGKSGLYALSIVVSAVFLLVVAGHAQSMGEWYWNESYNMSTARYAPTATSMADGRVLVAGGYNGSSCVTSAQLFDSANNSFVTTGSLLTGRNFATATLLDNGNVLVAGGYNTISGTLAIAELYNPSTGKFTKIRSSMKSRRELFTATKLPGGKVLLCGGYSIFNRGPVNTAEIYDPSNSKTPFTSTGLMKSKRFGHAAVLIPGTTKVLIVGGKDAIGSLRTAELYDINTKTFVNVGEMVYARDRCTAAWIESVGKVLVIGGKGNDITDELLVTEWFDPLTLTFTLGPSLIDERMAHTQTVLEDGSILVAGGWNSYSKKTTKTAERLVYENSQYIFKPTGYMAFDCHDHEATLLTDGRVLVVGGKQVDENPDPDVVNWLRRWEIYNP